MELQVGKRYLTRNGRETGVLIFEECSFGYSFKDPTRVDCEGKKQCWKKDGFAISHRIETENDIISPLEYTQTKIPF
ncbi:hypothetical protein SAMN05421827_105114 [Pedobacter terrae]|uniref:Uncharacterized protein n=1 Tax=Pedobacter terrae TaxID=405671 RepID=A0A1G7T8T8_9SPHI|nr:hypothetical protein [Pedobacter terrae]SDG31716.1 hypothetical protein SAMN05421827_105114 [Pedobacter terrae]